LPPFGSLYRFVQRVDLKKKKIVLDCDAIVEPSIPYRRLYLAAGALVNSQLLANALKTTVYLSDHMVGRIGIVGLSDLLASGYVKQLGPFIYGREVYSGKCTNFIVDFRPKVEALDDDVNNFYGEQAFGILAKILRGLDLRRLNQALFNKFGFAVWSPKMEVWLQILEKDCISVSSTEIVRNSVRTIDVSIDHEIRSFLPNFETSKNVLMFDAQHVMGGNKFFCEKSNVQIMRQHNVEIVGYPSQIPVSEFHHTWSMIDEIKTITMTVEKDEK